MPLSRRAALAAVLAVLLVTPALGAAASAAPARPMPAPQPVAAVVGGPKVVIVVGAVESVTPSFRTDADAIYAEAIRYTSNVVKVYSPNATWAKVQAAAQGASIFIYLGHGYGFPSPYKTVLTPSVHDGMGLNEIGGISDSDKEYYGESVVSAGIRLAKNAIVLLNHLCYSAGSSESGDPEPTIPVAKQRVDNFASGFLRTGARAVMADSATGNIVAMIRSIFTTHQSIGAAWHGQAWAKHHDIVWQSLRNPAYTADMDPDTTTTGFHRSLVGDFDMTTDEILAGASAARTDTAPDTQSPLLWSLDGPTTISPNFDGDTDNVNLVARFSESVSWTATVTDPGGTALRTLSGIGEVAGISWAPLNGGSPLPAGDYGLAIHAVDTSGNAPLDTSVVIHVVSLPVPGTGLQTFAPTVTLTNATSITYNLGFAGPVTGLAAADFTVTGSAASCAVGVPTGAGATWAVTVSGCATGAVTLQLEPRSVSDGTTSGPVGLIAARTVTVDRTGPKATTPRIAVKGNVTLSGSTLQGSMAWGGTDTGGAGILDYDVARSIDGGAFAVIATHLASPGMSVLLGAGHAYRFEVRARDKAGNVGAYVAASTWYPTLLQQTSTSIAWSGAWTTATSTSYSGGSASYAATAGASATYTFTGRTVAAVFARGPSLGEVVVYVDGVLISTLDTFSATKSTGWVGFARSWTSSTTHTVQLVVVGTTGRPTVVLDALELVR